MAFGPRRRGRNTAPPLNSFAPAGSPAARPRSDGVHAVCHPWNRGAVPDEFYTDDWFDSQARYERGEQEVSDEEFKQRSIISADPDEHLDRIEALEQLVPDGDVIVKLSNQSGRNALAAIQIYGERVLPKLRS